ncbi:hypothetical protein CJ030_MR6G006664 [Morella rubra]|uniref:Uncharacterized protein n=1 Tax=Morella rubra TaxID=262757 RepID=A0A6A1V960_9ROSI|nr:hypothetical protein CJ030_MR6G006664 [Morella rubra]
MSFPRSDRAQSSIPQSPLPERVTYEEPAANKTAQSTVTCVYHTNVAGYWRNVTVLWCRNLMNHTFGIKVDSLDGDFHYSCKIDLKPWHFWSKKGYKSFEVERNQVEVYWDLLASGPEPCAEDALFSALCWETTTLIENPGPLVEAVLVSK